MINELLNYGEVLLNEPMSKHTTFRVGGNAKAVVMPSSVTHLQELIKYLKDNNIKYKVLGNGSNVIISSNVSDTVFVLLNKLNAIEVHKDMNMIYAEAGALVPKVASEALNNSLTGLEFASGIPGCVGGSIFNNAGAYNACILDYIKSLTVIDENDNIVNLDHEDISYGYRTTMFKEGNKSIIVSAKFYLKDGDKEESLRITEDRRKRRMESQPVTEFTAGSVFRNPEIGSAWELIDRCGLKGYRVGGASVSMKHANFIVNDNNATGDDIKELIRIIKEKVYKETSVMLVEEQEYIGWE